MPTIVREGGHCTICGLAYKIGDDQRLFLSEWGVDHAHEDCFLQARRSLICLTCKEPLAPKEGCGKHPEGHTVVKIHERQER